MLGSTFTSCNPLTNLSILDSASYCAISLSISLSLLGTCTDVSFILLPACVTPLVNLPASFTFSSSSKSLATKPFLIAANISSSEAAGAGSAADGRRRQAHRR